MDCRLDGRGKRIRGAAGADRVANFALVGGAFVFSVLNIAGPIVAPRGAVTARGGKKTIEIPCFGRGDGIGDDAHAAKTFKEA
ncbi:hypothetical protein IVA87_00185 [Bradyrhizobium sp. 147]|uniref:hypothetical protein n=1 Tax=unclassified Bradyrhizobium TaxID=2631580 RepID=UPI001FF9D7B1|nr:MULTISPECIES: hypothetical protein [unclassified Bradyrhizobium]MCK1543014.1 hypothetical protein [Bradyrhizobium sp. 179]MCK1627623.1 hypothetical protein [Bradyrhizobium sp. 160]MCK1677929.1 hypothetical protein [Bradyrhizobium sp. 147]